jgi:hypothetical protein
MSKHFAHLIKLLLLNWTNFIKLLTARALLFLTAGTMAPGAQHGKSESVTGEYRNGCWYPIVAHTPAPHPGDSSGKQSVEQHGDTTNSEAEDNGMQLVVATSKPSADGHEALPMSTFQAVMLPFNVT